MTTDPHPHSRADRQRDHWHDHDVRGRGDNDVTCEFWGDGVGWSSQPIDTSDSADAARPAGLGASVGRWWSSTTSGRRSGTRTHGSAASPDRADDDVASADIASDDPATDWADAWDAAPPEPPRSGVDPLLARLGGLAVVLTLLVPVVMGFTSDDGDTVQTASIVADGPVAASADQPAEQPVAAASVAVGVATTASAASAASSDADATVAVAPTPAAAEATVTDAVEALTVDECALEYEIVDGDFWIRIADGSGAALADVLAVNDATVSTPLYPGRSICLPDEATIPSPPVPTTAVPTTVAPASSPSSTTTRSSSTNTSTTTPATTAPAPPPPPTSTASPSEVEAVIRSVWPDELEDHALEIARRESNLRPTARNSCCHGLFQVYWSAHRSWLSGLGVTSAAQLYDPATNARVALALYERAGGWGPWGG